jgi:acetate CoA/acetoacetate CoA-transferase alpha subunit
MRTLSLDQSVAMIPDGASLMIGGFMAVGTPERIIDEIVRQGKRDLTVIANDTAVPGKGIGKLVEAKRLRKVIVSHTGLNPEAQQQMMAGELEVELVPQGTLIERIRCGGHGLGGILTQTGLGTPVEKAKQRIGVDGKTYLLEIALRADFALVQAFLADYLGNLSYALTARNFNPVTGRAPARSCRDSRAHRRLSRRQCVSPARNRRHSPRGGLPESFGRACSSISALEFRAWSRNISPPTCRFSSSPRTD